MTTASNAIRVHIRHMIRRDLPEVLGIENDSFDEPWSEEDFIRCLRQRNCIGMVAEHNDRVVSFMIYELHRTRLHILNLAVRRTHRRQDVGTQMVRKLVNKLSQQCRNYILLEVRDSNLSAHLFLAATGFLAISTLYGFFNNGEDAYLFQRNFRRTDKETP